MRQEITVQRKLPVNLDPKDLPLFNNSIKASFERQHPVFIKNAWILQDTVFSPGEFKFYAHLTHIAKLGPIQFAKRAAYCATKSWKKIPKGMWVIDEWSPNYFHWIADCLPRIWEGLEKDPECPLILPESYKSLSFVTQSLDLLGLRVIYYKSNVNLQVDLLILTAKTAPFPHFHVERTLNTRERLAKTILKEPWRKVYISRSLALKRKAHNEPDVEVLLKKRGYEIYHAERLNFVQQIQLMAETQVLVSLHGAALTNMIFLPKTSKVLELRNAGDSLTQCYFNLASVLGLPYYYTLNQGDSANTIITEFTINIEALQMALDEIEGLDN
ncbi:glycosyltransferase family 61 protein [Algoriphagus mannitolivorans]|uniref:glycosyltransferase family 61 protein n=1 Tax=Algoriphagus mannitolivorans TaxID=226504 RepID=UPI00146FBE35|nr:glycosyltransferase family 61 protein [Algoriphagus mannitolivorans]